MPLLRTTLAAVYCGISRKKKTRCACTNKEEAVQNRYMLKTKIASSEPIWLQVARRELGVKETSGKGNTKRVLEYHQASSLKATMDSVPWCASFVNWCLEVSGVKSPRSAAARSFLRWGKPVSKVAPGCIAVFSRGTNPAEGHVGFVVGADVDFIHVLSGNQSDAVCIQKYPKSRLLGLRLPVSA